MVADLVENDRGDVGDAGVVEAVLTAAEDLRGNREGAASITGHAEAVGRMGVAIAAALGPNGDVAGRVRHRSERLDAAPDLQFRAKPDRARLPGGRDVVEVVLSRGENRDAGIRCDAGKALQVDLLIGRIDVAGTGEAGVAGDGQLRKASVQGRDDGDLVGCRREQAPERFRPGLAVESDEVHDHVADGLRRVGRNEDRSVCRGRREGRHDDVRERDDAPARSRTFDGEAAGDREAGKAVLNRRDDGQELVAAGIDEEPHGAAERVGAGDRLLQRADAVRIGQAVAGGGAVEGDVDRVRIGRLLRIDIVASCKRAIGLPPDREGRNIRVTGYGKR